MRHMYFQPRNIKLPHAAELRRLVGLGIGRVELAEKYDCTLKRVTDRLRELGLVAPMHGELRSADPSGFPSVFVHRTSGTVSLAANSYYLSSRQEKSKWA